MQEAVMLCKKPIEERKVPRGYMTGTRVYALAMLQREDGQPLAQYISGDGEVIARIAIAFAPPRITIFSA